MATGGSSVKKVMFQLKEPCLPWKSTFEFLNFNRNEKQTTNIKELEMRWGSGKIVFHRFSSAKIRIQDVCILPELIHWWLAVDFNIRPTNKHIYQLLLYKHLYQLLLSLGSWNTYCTEIFDFLKLYHHLSHAIPAA